ncbi:hypothetical protein RvY_10971 [Ramazzottius varieornatus]|uniref:Uncharacterized protein n=1 Tax=Ramazzottius varieornatus TaxID=947166 RepID=A0A1D1VEJ6_RAMVA|nr:hypothetical protein RvY_10971 [Ramazzottius varieornatus]
MAVPNQTIKIIYTVAVKERRSIIGCATIRLANMYPISQRDNIKVSHRQKALYRRRSGVSSKQAFFDGWNKQRLPIKRSTGRNKLPHLSIFSFDE